MASKEEREKKRLADLDAQMRVKVQELQEVDSLLAEKKSEVSVAEKKEQEASDRLEVTLTTIKNKNDEVERLEAYVGAIILKETTSLLKIQENEVVIAYQNVTIANLTESIRQKTLDEHEATSSLAYTEITIAEENKKIEALKEQRRLLENEIGKNETYRKEIVEKRQEIETAIEEAVSDFRIYEQRINMLEEMTGYTVKKPKI